MTPKILIETFMFNFSKKARLQLKELKVEGLLQKSKMLCEINFSGTLLHSQVKSSSYLITAHCANFTLQIFTAILESLAVIHLPL